MSTAATSERHPWQEGQDGRHRVYQERLHAHWSAWALCVFMTASLGVAFGYATDTRWGLITFVVSQAVGSWVLLATTALVRVDERVLRAGRARLPRAYVGRVRVLDASASRRLRGAEADPAAYQCARSWVPRSVAVEVTDPLDPHPYWVVSSRDPERLAAALTESPHPVAE